MNGGSKFSMADADATIAASSGNSTVITTAPPSVTAGAPEPDVVNEPAEDDASAMVKAACEPSLGAAVDIDLEGTELLDIDNL